MAVKHRKRFLPLPPFEGTNNNSQGINNYVEEQTVVWHTSLCRSTTNRITVSLKASCLVSDARNPHENPAGRRPCPLFVRPFQIFIVLAEILFQALFKDSTRFYPEPRKIFLLLLFLLFSFSSFHPLWIRVIPRILCRKKFSST